MVFGKRKILFLLILIIFLTGCSSNGQFVVKAYDKPDMNRAAWIVYWDLSAGEKDLDKIGYKVGKLSYFGAYFDQMDRLFIPTELRDIKNEHKRKKMHYETYLSIINDRKNIDGSVLLKDIEVLKRWFSTDTLMDTHIEDIIKFAKEDDYDGIEIDYERVWKDEAVGRQFLRFVHKLCIDDDKVKFVNSALRMRMT